MKYIYVYGTVNDSVFNVLKIISKYKLKNGKIFLNNISDKGTKNIMNSFDNKSTI